MLSTNLISAIQAFSRQSKPLSTDLSSPAPKLAPGTELQGEVQASISPGLYKVLVAGQNVPVRLPETTRSGDIVKLRVISNVPQLTVSVIPSTAPISTQEQIGSVAKLLADLAERPVENLLTKQLGSAAVWSNQHTADPKQLAGALKDALATSGLFYESHQAQWIRGERSTAQLLIEPQNLLTDPSLSGKQPAAQDSTNTPTLKPADALSITKELIPLVQQQLHTLETHQLTWSGQVWPGQLMQWEIQGEPEHKSTAPAEDRQWHTEMELALPKLGDVHAKLTFNAQGLQLKLSAADSETIALFTRSMSELQTALAHADIPLVASVVTKS